jgi:molecular chaperone GrpE
MALLHLPGPFRLSRWSPKTRVPGDCLAIAEGYSAAATMTDREQDETAPSSGPPEQATRPGSSPPARPESPEDTAGPRAEAPTLEQKLADTQADAARLRDQLLRTAADFENFRKRSRREMDDAHRRGREGAIKDLLPVFDNLERAASHAGGGQDTKSVADGLRIVLKQFVDTLDKIGVTRITAVGQPFDPSVHEAIQHMPSTEVPAGTVLAEVQPGYRMGDHLLRASMVVVSKGPPAEQASN